MRIIKNILLIAFIAFISCNQKHHFINDSYLLTNIKYNLKISELDSSLIFFIVIDNKTDNYIYIPISYWFYDGKKDNFILSQPVNPGLLNTMHYYPTDSVISDAIIDIGWKPERGYYPTFLKIKSSKKGYLNLEIPKYKIDKNGDMYHLYNNRSYTFLLRLSIISKNNLENIADVKLDNIIAKDSIVFIKIPFLRYNKFDYNVFESRESLSQDESEILNRLSTNKLDIKFDYIIKYN